MSRMKSRRILPSSWTRGILFALLLAALGVAAAIADVIPVGTELAVNETTDGDQHMAAAPDVVNDSDRIAADAAGNFAVVWQGGTGSDIDVYVRLFNADGSPRTGAIHEIRVNTTIAGAQENPRIAMADNGKFVVTWRETGEKRVKARLFDASGSPLTGEINVSAKGNASTSYWPMSLAMDADGDFVVLYAKAPPPPNPVSILFQRYNAAGAAQGKATVAATSGIANPRDVLDMAADGSFVFVTSDFFQRYSASGTKVGPQFVYRGPSDPTLSDIAVAADGSFVLALSGQTGSDGLWAKTYNAGENTAASSFQVSASGGGGPIGVAIDDSSHELVFIHQVVDSANAKVDIVARRYDFTGNALTAEFPVNTTPLPGFLSHGSASVAKTVNGGFVVAWDRKTDGDNRDVFAQVYGFVSP